MSPELPPFCNVRARAAAAKARSRRVTSPRRTRSRFAFAAPSHAYRGALTVFAVAALMLAWYGISRDQQEQQVIREQTSRIQFQAPGP
jgi:uncharacterized membrane protein